MGFCELALEDMAYTGWMVEDQTKGRRMIASLMNRLDDSWNLLYATTKSVMCVTVACAHDPNRDLARQLISTMSGMMLDICESWAADVGVVTRKKFETEELLKMLGSTDFLGKELGYRASGLLGAVMLTLLSEIPKEWGTHFKLVNESMISLGGILPDSDVSWVLKMVADEQANLCSGWFQDVDESMVDGSPQMQSSDQWVERASVVFDKFHHLGSSLAMQEVVKSVGFPS